MNPPPDRDLQAADPVVRTPSAPATPRDIVVIGASAGGVEALKAVLGALPPDYDGTVCVVLHIPPSVPSVLAHILGRSTHLVCVSAYDGAPVRPGVIYVAPPDWHLLLEEGRVRLQRGPRENGHRPAVDPLFRSAAAAYGPRVVGVVLTGNLDDGTRGLFAIKDRGGLAVVQTPGDAMYPSMPRNAAEHVAVDYVLPADGIGALLAAAAKGQSPPALAASAHRPTDVPLDGLPDALQQIAILEVESASVGAYADAPSADGRSDGAANGTRGANAKAANVGVGAHGAANGAAYAAAADGESPVRHAADLATGVGRVNRGALINEELGGVVSGYTCPECHGSLWELHEGALVRYRCRVGHSYTEPGLVDNKARAVEDALWTALTALEESAAISQRVAERATRQGRDLNASTFRQRAEHLERRGAVLRDLLSTLPGHVDGV